MKENEKKANPPLMPNPIGTAPNVFSNAATQNQKKDFSIPHSDPAINDKSVFVDSTLTSENEWQAREASLARRIQALEKREAELAEREEALKVAETEKKQVLLRIPRSLWLSLARWADDEMRSINGQIEYLLTRAVNERKR